MSWMIVIYLFSLVVLLISSFWSLNPLTSQVEHAWSLKNYQTIIHGSVYWRVTFRTVMLAAAVTVTLVLAVLPNPALPAAQAAASGLQLVSSRPLSPRLVELTFHTDALTADTHVRNILRKLGVGSRAQVASWATSQGLVAPRSN